MKPLSHRRDSSRGQTPSLEALEARMLLSAFVSTTGIGNWSALSTWATQDGGAVTRLPTLGDTVTINGKVTVDVATSVGTGSGNVITLGNATIMGDKQLTVSAPLTVRGSILSQGKAVISVQAGAGIEFDDDATFLPQIHCVPGQQINLYFYGTADNHAYLRTMAGTLGLPLQVRDDSGGDVVNVGGTYVDFTDVKKSDTLGMTIRPNDAGLIKKLDHCTFTRTSVFILTSLSSMTQQYTLSNSIFIDGQANYTGDHYSCWFAGKNLINLTADSFDKKIYVSAANNITSCVFNGSPWLDAYSTHNFNTWSDNLINIIDAANGYFVSRTGVYNRTYLTCIIPSVSNPHISSMDTNETYNQVIIDVPLANDVDDADMILSNTVKNDVVQRSFSLPHIGGPYPGAGASLGFICGTQVYYHHNTIAIGNNPGLRTDAGHGGVTGGLAEFTSNIGFSPDGAVTGGSGYLIDQHAMEPTYIDPVLPQNCDYNALYRTSYHMVSSAAPGAHDVTGVNPNFIDSTRNLTTFYRTHSGVAPSTVAIDVPAAVAWIIQHPELVPQMIDWVSNGYIPTNIAYKAAADNVAPTNGWIGAMEGKPVGDANLDGKTNFQDYIVLERNFGQANMGWEGGDFNNDGVVNFQDYIILERNFGTSYVSAAPGQGVASPVELAASITPTSGTDLPTATPVVGPVAPLHVLNGTTPPVSTPSTLFSNTGPVALPTSASTGPTLRTVTWPKAQKWQLPPAKGLADGAMIDVLAAAVL